MFEYIHAGYIPGNVYEVKSVRSMVWSGNTYDVIKREDIDKYLELGKEKIESIYPYVNQALIKDALVYYIKSFFIPGNFVYHLFVRNNPNNEFSLDTITGADIRHIRAYRLYDGTVIRTSDVISNSSNSIDDGVFYQARDKGNGITYRSGPTGIKLLLNRNVVFEYTYKQDKIFTTPISFDTRPSVIKDLNTVLMETFNVEKYMFIGTENHYEIFNVA